MELGAIRVLYLATIGDRGVSMVSKEKQKEYNYRKYQKHKEALNRAYKKYKQETKKRVLTYYGNGELACVKCGFEDLRALSIDHIGGGGSNHRRTLKEPRNNFYHWLEKHYYPDGYQTLCMNCQFIKREVEKECSHLKK